MEVRERILKTAEELFMKFGIRSVTMDEIASELGISKKTIYMHFEDKDAIVHEVATFRMNYKSRHFPTKLLIDSDEMLSSSGICRFFIF